MNKEKAEKHEPSPKDYAEQIAIWIRANAPNTLPDGTLLPLKVALTSKAELIARQLFPKKRFTEAQMHAIKDEMKTIFNNGPKVKHSGIHHSKQKLWGKVRPEEREKKITPRDNFEDDSEDVDEGG